MIMPDDQKKREERYWELKKVIHGLKEHKDLLIYRYFDGFRKEGGIL